MSTEQPAIVTVPTEMGRQDGFFDSAILLGSGLAVWWFALRGVPVWLFAPPMLALSIFVLTGEPAGDVPFIGAIAAGLRGKLGLRRAHEWCLAYVHYFHVRQWPDFTHWSSTKWQNSRLIKWQNSRLKSKTALPTYRLAKRMQGFSQRLPQRAFGIPLNRLPRLFTRP